MYSVTFGIGWLIWSLVVWGQGQTPGKQIVKLRVYDKTTGAPVKWGHMALREVALPATLGIVFWALAFFTGLVGRISDQPNLFLIVYIPFIILNLLDIFWIFKNGNRNRLVDVIFKTDVLNESNTPSI
jgi:uncharacterized RDD family membrane protein YckC